MPRSSAALTAAALAALPLLAGGCAAGAGPSRDLSLRHVVLYQNGIGYFERAGVLREERLRLRLREREMDDVLKTLVVVEQGSGGGRKPSTVTALLPQAPRKSAEAKDPDETTWLDVVLSPHPPGEISIAYAVPTAAWKSAYRVVLPDVKERASDPNAGPAPAQAPAQATAPPQALLQAWALVDNVSDEDWTGIELTLATGAPFTFTTHLRDLRFVDRPEANLGEGAAGPRGPVYAESTRGIDRDGDGIPDAEDACPDERGAPSPEPRNNGCPQFTRRISGSSEIQILKTVQFGPDGDAIPPAAHAVLDEIVRLLQANREIAHIVVEGHASNREKHPADLSDRRASAVRAYLVAHGVDGARLSARGFGELRPVADNNTEAGRAQNRRVELHVEQPPAGKQLKVHEPAPSSPVADVDRMAGTAAGSAVPRPAPGTLRYDITHPVTLPKQSTTMVTIVNERVPGEDILLFRPEASVAGSDVHPFHAARIENRSGFALQTGPVAIFGGGTFVGEGLIDALARKQVAFIPYGLDADATVRVEPRSSRTPLRVIAAAEGILTVEDQLTLTTRYHVSVGDRPPGRLFLRHRRTPGYEPEKAPPDAEKTDDALLLPVAIASGWQGDVSVEERRRVREGLSILSTDAPRLAAYLQGSKLDPAAEKKLREIVTLRADVDRLDRETDALRTRLTDLAQRASELRESLRTLEKTPRAAALQAKILERLGEATKASEDLSRKLADDGAALSEARAGVADGLRDLVIAEEKPKDKP